MIEDDTTREGPEEPDDENKDFPYASGDTVGWLEENVAFRPFGYEW